MANVENNLETTIRARIQEIANKLDREFNDVVIEFGLERVLYRLSKSRFMGRFVLKGGMLVSHWSEDPYRFSQDLDFLSFAKNSDDVLIEIFTEILRIRANDGLKFDIGSISTTNIMLKEEYIGKRVRVFMNFRRTRVRISIDIGFGDALPFPSYEVEIPSMVGLELTKVRAYSPETVIAEKLHAVVRFGMINTRMKDYYDLWVLLHKIEINVADLRVAIESTFKRRGSKIPEGGISGLSKNYATRTKNIELWTEYSKNTIIADKSLFEVVTEVKNKLSDVVLC